MTNAADAYEPSNFRNLGDAIDRTGDPDEQPPRIAPPP
jgi:hypothetical protein